MLETPLIEEHRTAGARLVPFAGWTLPLHYGSQIDEHHAVRRNAGLFDISHMLVIDVEGAGAHDFLRHALANDIGRFSQPGEALYSCLLNPQGGIVDDLMVYWLDPERYRLVVNAATADNDLAWLAKFAIDRVSLTPRRDLALIAVQGPNARAICWSALPALRDRAAPLAPFQGVATDDVYVARTGYTGEDGLELILPANTATRAWRRLRDAGARPCGLGARDTLRLEAGLNLYGQDMDETVMPSECGLAWTVRSSPQRDFVGKAALAARTPVCSLLGIVLDDRAGVLRAHQPVETAHGAGVVTSGTFSPTLQQSIALARLPPATRPGDHAHIPIRGKRVAAHVVKPPFVRNGKILV